MERPRAPSINRRSRSRHRFRESAGGGRGPRSLGPLRLEDNPALLTNRVSAVAGMPAVVNSVAAVDGEGPRRAPVPALHRLADRPTHVGPRAGVRRAGGRAAARSRQRRGEPPVRADRRGRRRRPRRCARGRGVLRPRLRIPKAGKRAAIAAGLRASDPETDVVVVLDADTIWPPDARLQRGRAPRGRGDRTQWSRCGSRRSRRCSTRVGSRGPIVPTFRPFARRCCRTSRRRRSLWPCRETTPREALHSPRRRRRPQRGAQAARQPRAPTPPPQGCGSRAESRPARLLPAGHRRPVNSLSLTAAARRRPRTRPRCAGGVPRTTTSGGRRIAPAAGPRVGVRRPEQAGRRRCQSSGGIGGHRVLTLALVAVT